MSDFEEQSNAGAGPDVLPLGLAGRILLRNWLLLLIGLILGVAGGLLLARNVAPTYSATSTQLVKGIPGTGVAANYEAAQFAVSRARSYPSFIYSQQVLDGVGRDMGDGSIDDALRSLTATNPADTTLVKITATGRTAAEAKDRANSAARHMATFITDIETVSGKTPISVETAVQALMPQNPSDPRPSVYAAIGGSIGLVVAIVLAVARYFAAQRRRPRQSPSPRIRRFGGRTKATGAPPRALVEPIEPSPDPDPLTDEPRTRRRRGRLPSRPVHSRL